MTNAPKVIDAEESRYSIFKMNPEALVLDDEARGRTVQPTLDEVMEMAVSIHDLGQLQPVVTRNVNGRRHVVAGFHRTAAIRLLRQGFEWRGKKYHIPDLRIEVKHIETNIEEGLVANIAENIHRRSTDPITDAMNQRTLRTQGWDDQRIAEFYRTSKQEVAKAARLLELSNDQRALVSSGKMAVTTALDLLALPEKSRTEAVKEATKQVKTPKGETKVKVDGKAVKEALRQQVVADATDNLPTVTKVKKPKTDRTYAELKAVIAAQDPHSVALKKFLDSLLGYAKGEVDETAVGKAITKLDQLIA